MSKILKNTSGSIVDLTKLGITIPALGQITVVPQDYTLLAMPLVIAELSPLITAGTVVVNDGTNNLSVARGIDYLSLPDYAYATRFNNATNGFLSTDVQSAIEEATRILTVIEVSSVTAPTTTSATDALLTTMSITPTPGKYLLLFSTSITANQGGAAVSVSAYINGVQDGSSLRKIAPFDGGALSATDGRGAVSINRTITVTSGAVEIRWSTSGGTATGGPRVMTLIRYG